MRHRAQSHADAAANFVVVNASTPAQYFHALRRQALAPHLKPLVVLSPKSLLHHRPCNSALESFGPGTPFRAVIADGDEGDNTRPRGASGVGSSPGEGDGTAIRRVVMCSGKVFYALHRARRAKRVAHVALVRVEQLVPFPHEALAGRLRRYPGAELVWCQEEPKNMGFWTFVQPRVNTAVRELLHTDDCTHSTAGGGGGGDLHGQTVCTVKQTVSAFEQSRSSHGPTVRDGGQRSAGVRYVGRPAAASPATGSPTIHAAETRALINEALGLTKKTAWD